MASREENERQTEALKLWWRRMMYVLLLAVVVAGGVWFVRWVSGGIGMNKIGEHYKQADDY